MIYDKFAIALVISDLIAVDHISKFMSKLTYVFLKHGGHIKCKITMVKKYLKDLKQSGIEIPPRLTANYANKRMTDVMIEKLKILVEE